MVLFLPMQYYNENIHYALLKLEDTMVHHLFELNKSLKVSVILLNFDIAAICLNVELRQTLAQHCTNLETLTVGCLPGSQCNIIYENQQTLTMNFSAEVRHHLLIEKQICQTRGNPIAQLKIVQFEF